MTVRSEIKNMRKRRRGNTKNDVDITANLGIEMATRTECSLVDRTEVTWFPITDVGPVIDGDDEDEKEEKEKEAAEVVEIDVGIEVNQIDSLEKDELEC